MRPNVGAGEIDAVATVSVNAFVFVTPPPVAVTLTVYVPGGVVAAVAMERVVEHGGGQDVGEKEEETPVGSPETVKVTGCAWPAARDAVMVFATDCPCVTVRLPEVETEKSKATLLFTLTVTAAETVRFPAASRATAVSVCKPLGTPVVFQERV
jgi:hypothetical protein